MTTIKKKIEKTHQMWIRRLVKVSEESWIINKKVLPQKKELVATGHEIMFVTMKMHLKQHSTTFRKHSSIKKANNYE